MDTANSRTRGPDAPERLSEFPGKWRGPQRSDETAQHQALAAVAHELRLPLSHIKGFVTSLRRADIEWMRRRGEISLRKLIWKRTDSHSWWRNFAPRGAQRSVGSPLARPMAATHL